MLFRSSGTAGTIILSAIRVSDSGTDTLTIPINSGTATTYYSAVTSPGSTTKYIQINAVSTNGFNSSAGSTFEIWVR